MKKQNITYEKKVAMCALVTLWSIAIYCQNSSDKKLEKQTDIFQLNKEKIIQPILAIEAWGIYNVEKQIEETKYLSQTDVSFRRLRIGAKGTPFFWFQYTVQLNLDRLGENSTKASDGKVNIWNAYTSIQLLPGKDVLYLHAGYFWATLSRETNTSPWAISSFDKTNADWYLRKFLTGKGNGIESGLGLGGLYNLKWLGIGYRLGLYEPTVYANINSSKLYTGRVMLSLGEAEQKTYTYTLSGNQWNSRNGVTLGFGASIQQNGTLTDTTHFSSSTVIGPDALINFGGLRIDGAYYHMKRSADNIATFYATLWQIKVSYNLKIRNAFLEPAISYDTYTASGSSSLFKHTGSDNSLDVGINLYLNKDKLKLSVHYIIQDGDASPDTGDYIGTALQFRL